MPQDAFKSKIGNPIPKTGKRLLGAVTGAMKQGQEKTAIYICPWCMAKLEYSDCITPYCRECGEQMVKQKENDNQ